MHDRSQADTAPFEEVRRIAVLRGGGLGDLVFTFPALEALAARYPAAEIVLLGTRLHRELLAGRPGPVARVEPLPSAPGVHDGGEEPLASFVARMRAEHFDLACQLHGGGRHSNPFVHSLGARHAVGARTPDAAPLERTLPYLYYQHEVLRWLEVAGLAGASHEVVMEPRLAVRLEEVAQAARLRERWPEGIVVLHPGATDPRRRWPAARFAEVARRCADDGRRVLVVGDAADAALADAVAAGAGSPRVASLAGTLSLPQLVGVLAAADVFVGNDSGPRHLAQAIGCPTVGVFWIGNMINGGPLTRRRHRVQLSWTRRCPVCGVDVTQGGWAAPRCGHDVSFVADVPAQAVLADVRSLCELTATTAPPQGT